MKAYAPRFPTVFGSAIVTALILLIPLIAMQFSSEVDWGVMDFVAAGVLLMAAGITLGVVTGKASSPTYRAVVVGAILAVFGVIWLELAVGIVNIAGS